MACKNEQVSVFEEQVNKTKLYLDGVPVSHELPCSFVNHVGIC